MVDKEKGRRGSEVLCVMCYSMEFLRYFEGSRKIKDWNQIFILERLLLIVWRMVWEKSMQYVQNFLQEDFIL